MQARTGTVISGSNVVQFFDRTYYEEADLDLYVNPGHGEEVGVHMVATQGYRVVERVDEQDDQNRQDAQVTLNLQDSLGRVVGMATGAHNAAMLTRYTQRSVHVVCFLERITDNGNKLRAQIIVTSDCVFNAIMNFHSTCVMNVITYDRAVSLYPMATFETRTNHHLVPYGTRTSSLCVARRSVKSSRELFMHGCDRKVGDRWCWSIKFDMTGVNPREWVESEPWHYEPESAPESLQRHSPEDPFMVNKWRMSGAANRMVMKYCLLDLPIFKYTYSVADEFEAARARQFYDELMIVIESGGTIVRDWFDDNVLTITEGRIVVWLDDWNISQEGLSETQVASVSGPTDQTNAAGGTLPARKAFPVKLTEYIEDSELESMLTSYRKAFEDEELKGQRWRARRDKRRGEGPSINGLPVEILTRILRECYTAQYYHSQTLCWPADIDSPGWPGFVQLSSVCDLWKNIIWDAGWELDAIGLVWTQDGRNSPSDTVHYNLLPWTDEWIMQHRAANGQTENRKQFVVDLEMDSEVYSTDIIEYANISRDVQVLSMESRDGPELCMYWFQWLSHFPHDKLRTVVMKPIMEPHQMYPVTQSSIELNTSAPLLSTIYFQGAITAGFTMHGLQNLSVVILHNCTMSNVSDYQRFTDAVSGTRLQYLEIIYARRCYADDDPGDANGTFGGLGLTARTRQLTYLAVSNLRSAHVLHFLRMFQSTMLRRLFLSIKTMVNTRWISEVLDDVDADFPIDEGPRQEEGDSLAGIKSLELHLCHSPNNLTARCRSDLRQSKVIRIVQQLADHIPGIEELQWEAGTHCIARLFGWGGRWHNLRSVWLWESHDKDNPPLDEVRGAPGYDDQEPITVDEYGDWETMRVNICTLPQVNKLIAICEGQGITLERIYVERGMWRVGDTGGPQTPAGSEITTPRPSHSHRGISKDYSRMHDKVQEQGNQCPLPNNSWPTQWIMLKQ
ncbi:hypothetical protein HWV62_45099 [Athelia sp. TMB]|nr:hypothetical protein HWV62_45099 [Athelia sp. TMB]